MHKVLDDFIDSRREEFKNKRESVLTVEGRTILADLTNAQMRSELFQTRADYVVINDAYRRTARIISPDITRTYTEKRAEENPEADEDFEDALIEAREDIGALGLMENLSIVFDTAAEKLSSQWLNQYREQIKQLPDDRQEAYRQITALSREPQDIDLALPVTSMEATAVREKDGTESKLPTFENHLLCDENGHYPSELKDWERAVLKAESGRSGFKFWYRNPDRPSQDSLGIAYEDDGETKILRPDFLFFAECANGDIVVDIVDPHGYHLADALPKLRGLAHYAETHADKFRRIEAVAEINGKLRFLDLTKPEIRQAVTKATGAKGLYESEIARDYV
jgi:hypothetical protein